MSGLLFLNSDDFNIQQGTKGNIMCHNVRGFSLILFYSTHCIHCQGLIPIFKKLPGTIGGCQFGMVNISTNRPCVKMSESTIAPITYVPYIVLYVDGRPFMVYKGPYNSEEICRFVIEVANNIQKKQQFSKERVKDSPNNIPEYCLGKPIGGEKVCYLDFNNAYKS
jgi:thiol-disulfide isomerase/thioredoxin